MFVWLVSRRGNKRRFSATVAQLLLSTVLIAATAALLLFAAKTLPHLPMVDAADVYYSVPPSEVNSRVGSPRSGITGDDIPLRALSTPGTPQRKLSLTTEEVAALAGAYEASMPSIPENVDSSTLTFPQGNDALMLQDGVELTGSSTDVAVVAQNVSQPQPAVQPLQAVAMVMAGPIPRVINILNGVAPIMPARRRRVVTGRRGSLLCGVCAVGMPRNSWRNVTSVVKGGTRLLDVASLVRDRSLV